jgi:peroxiredoxin Q/BCP
MPDRSPPPVGSHAPDFSLSDQRGFVRRLSDLYAAGPVVLYFYPKNHTLGCTIEACNFRDRYQAFAEAGASVVGVSSDSVTSHGHFAAQHELPFTLLSDPGGRIRELYGIKKTLGILPGRVTFVIDQSGLIRHVYTSQLNAAKHVAQAAETVRKLCEAPTAT